MSLQKIRWKNGNTTLLIKKLGQRVINFTISEFSLSKYVCNISRTHSNTDTHKHCNAHNMIKFQIKEEFPIFSISKTCTYIVYREGAETMSYILRYSYGYFFTWKSNQKDCLYSKKITDFPSKIGRQASQISTICVFCSDKFRQSSHSGSFKVRRNAIKKG